MRRGKRGAYVAGALLTLAVASPGLQNLRPRAQRVDGFPLSYYPMFSAARSASGTVNHLIGVDADGTERLLGFQHAGTGGFNQVRRQINRRVGAGKADVLAREVAESVARNGDDSDGHIVTVRVVRSLHRYDDFYRGNRTPQRREILASAPVPHDREISHA